MTLPAAWTISLTLHVPLLNYCGLWTDVFFWLDQRV